MDWMRVSYSIQVNTMESQEFRTRPVPHWFFCLSETSEGPIQRMYFVILLPNGMILEPKVSERLWLLARYGRRNVGFRQRFRDEGRRGGMQQNGCKLGQGEPTRPIGSSRDYCW